MKQVTLTISLIALFATFYLEAANPQALRELQSRLDDVRYEVMNQEMTLRTFGEKFANQEAIVESLAQQLDREQRSSRDMFKGNHTVLEQKLKGIETLLKGLADDVRTLQKHANETTDALVQSQKRLNELEAITSHHTSDMDHMKTAVAAVMDAFGTASPEKVHIVKYGDTLGDIAMRNHTTIKAIKEVNRLNNDSIREGQKLKLP